jgi:hypothetical protein
MELNNFHNIEFDLYKIKDVDVFGIFKNKVEKKLRENNIKYDIKIIDENEMFGGSKSTYPYNHFEETIDTIIGKKIENKNERKDIFKFLFSTNDKNEQPVNKSNKETGFFDYFNNNKKTNNTKELNVKPEVKPEVKSDANSGSNFNIFNMEIFKRNESEVKDIKDSEKKTEEKELNETAKPVEKIPETPEEKELINIEKPSQNLSEKNDVPKEKELIKNIPSYDEDNDEKIKEFIKSQSTFIKVIVSIYHDEKNEKILPTIIGIKKWGFS